MLRKRATEALPWSSSQPVGLGATLRARAIEAFKAAKPVLLRALEQAQRWAAKNKGKACLAALAAAAFCLNFKRLPFVWHLRVFYNIWFPRKRYFDSRPGSVFRPVVTPSRVALLETDYNLHKSNSTYFSDLDVARTDLLAALRSQAIRGGLYKEYKEGVQVLLAGTSCNFKKEIKIGVAFDMHSRILSWDRKWIYVITHFAEKRKKSVNGKAPSRSPSVYATAISKCVVKAGRLTVPPEKFFQAAGVLRTEVPNLNWVDGNTSSESLSKSKKEKKSKDKDSKKRDKGEKSSRRHGDSTSSLPTVPAPPPPVAGGGWTWERVEEERARALKVAEGFANGLDAAHEEFRILG
ncbi:putative thioesterase atnL [Colletotrichum sp. SAR11_239]|nr:putative thioesterase atnL [Colletotrichum sp. SAR11_239]